MYGKNQSLFLFWLIWLSFLFWICHNSIFEVWSGMKWVKASSLLLHHVVIFQFIKLRKLQRDEQFLSKSSLPLKLVPAIFIKFLFFNQTIALQKLWKMLFISSKKLFSFLRYSFFCVYVLPSFSTCQSLL